MAGRLAGRVAIVTGGASGIGAAIGRAFAAEGAHVTLADRDLAAARDVAASIGSTALAVATDVTREGDVTAMVAATLARHPRIDVLVNNAGIIRKAWVKDMTEAVWDEVLDVNLKATFLCSKAVLPAMIGAARGRIVNIASIAGKEGNPMAGAYSSSKAAVIGVTKAIGKDVAGTGILVNCIAPAVIRTPMLGQLSDEHLEYMTSRIPLSRVGEPSEVAALICWLASEEMSFSTGAVFDISGGRATY
jgi:3-oxoacyl-[acyl-carrier protein] reductase